MIDFGRLTELGLAYFQGIPLLLFEFVVLALLSLVLASGLSDQFVEVEVSRVICPQPNMLRTRVVKVNEFIIEAALVGDNRCLG